LLTLGPDCPLITTDEGVFAAMVNRELSLPYFFVEKLLILTKRTIAKS